MLTHFETNHFVHVAGNSARICRDIEGCRKTQLPINCHQNSGANLDTFAQEQSLVSSQYFVSEKCVWSVDRRKQYLGLREGSWLRLLKIVWKWWLPHAVRRVCPTGNIMGNLVVNDATVFVTTINGTFRRNSRQNWQSVSKTASERWEIDLMKEIRRDVKVVGDYLSDLILEIHRITQIPMYSLQQLSKRAETVPRAHAKDLVLHLCLYQYRKNRQRCVLLVRTLVAL